jgi:hypothetical protein
LRHSRHDIRRFGEPKRRWADLPVRLTFFTSPKRAFGHLYTSFQGGVPVLSPSSRLRPNEAEVAAKVMDGEAIIINLANGMYYSMDQVGGLIWELIDEGRSVAEIASAISRSYDVPAARASADVERLATDLLEEKLVCVAEQDGQVRDVHKPEREPKLRYETPQLNKYRDMGDLLALDPPMPGLTDIPWQETSERPSR